MVSIHTRRYHRRHGSVGHVWQGRFRSPVVEDVDHLLTVLRDIEANPLRANMVGELSDYPRSSYGAHGLGRPDPVLSEFPEWDSLGGSAAQRQYRWRRRVAAPAVEADLSGVRESIRTG
jgi:putative transposase